MRWIFPVGPFGISSTTTIRRGTLNGATVCATKSCRARASTPAFGRRTTAAATSSPSRSCGTANVTACATEGCRSKTSSISSGETFSPALLMISFSRPCRTRYPSLVETALVPRPKPAVGESRGVRLVVRLVTGEDVLSADRDLADLAGGNQVTFGVEDRDVRPCGRPDRAGLPQARWKRVAGHLMGRLGHAVCLDDRRLEHGLEPFEHEPERALRTTSGRSGSVCP